MNLSRRFALRGTIVAGTLAVAGVIGRAWTQDAFFPASGAGYEPWTDWREPGATPGERILRGAILAANPHNSQPWKFRISGGGIDVYADSRRSIGAIDPLHREMFIGVGCALENLAICARAEGLVPVVQLLPDAANPWHAATIKLTPGTAQTSDLYTAIPRRHTHRGAYVADKRLPVGLLSDLTGLTSDLPMVRLQWLAEEDQRARFSSLVAQATEAIIADEEQSQDSARWFRNSASDIHRMRDGLTLDAQALSPGVDFVAKLLPSIGRATADREWLRATREVQLPTAAAFGILRVPDGHSNALRITAGRVWQRMQLWATVRGLAMQPLNQLTERADREHQVDLQPRFSAELRALAPDPGWEALMPFRIGFPERVALPSPRRSLREVLLPA